MNNIHLNDKDKLIVGEIECCKHEKSSTNNPIKKTCIDLKINALKRKLNKHKN